MNRFASAFGIGVMTPVSGPPHLAEELIDRHEGLV